MNLLAIVTAMIDYNKRSNEAYNIYADLMLKSDMEYRLNGDTAEYQRLIDESNVAFESYEYAAGIRSID